MDADKKHTHLRPCHPDPDTLTLILTPTQAIGGFPEGTGFVERIVCSRGEANPPFTISKTPGDGDCLFYAMMDVAIEAHRDSLLPAELEVDLNPKPEIRNSLRILR